MIRSAILITLILTTIYQYGYEWHARKVLREHLHGLEAIELRYRMELNEKTARHRALIEIFEAVGGEEWTELH